MMMIKLIVVFLFTELLTVAIALVDSDGPTCTCSTYCPPCTNNNPPQCTDDSNDTMTEDIEKLWNALYDLKNTSYTSSAKLNNILMFVEELIAMHNVSSVSPLPSSCQDVQRRVPTSPSGVYLIAANEKKAEYVYCHMETLCGSEGGWTRIAHLDMTDPTEKCPAGTRLYQSNGVKGCGRPATNSGSCQSLIYPTNGIQYTQVCGMARGYQYGSPDALDDNNGGTVHQNDINSYYLDGVSLTRGNPRKHLWSFICGYDENNYGKSHCPCQQGSQQAAKIQTFIGSDYFCESGSKYNTALGHLYTTDPLWDGKNCGNLEVPCCTGSYPWFHKVLTTSTSDYIEARLCQDQGTVDEDVALEILEVYIK